MYLGGNMEVRLISCVKEDVANLATERCRSGEPFESMPQKDVLDKAIHSGHTAVMEFVDYVFAIDGISRSCLAQLTRHRMASFCVMSQRHADMVDFDYVIPKSIQNTKGIIQFRCEPYSQELDSDTLLEAYQHLMDDLNYIYSEFVKCGVPMEDARYILPNACTTNIIMKINARSLANFLSLRMCNKAQWEIRELADKIYRIVSKETPIVANYFGPNCWFDGCKEDFPCGNPRPIAVTKRIKRNDNED